MKITPTIFREYDIRGLVDSELPEEAVLAIGRGFGTYARKHGSKVLALGRDVRLTSDRFNELMTEGLTSTGCDLIDVGTLPTPLLYFSLFELPVEGGVMITASHNPSEYNGFKLCIGRETIYGQQIQDVLRIIQSGDFTKGKGSVRKQPDMIPRYIKWVKEHIKLNAPVRCVADAGNGTASLVAPQLLRELGCDVTELYCTPDGHFPNHHPDPTVAENLTDAIAAVKRTKAQVGLAFDGDSDRLGVIDDQGNILWGDQLLLIFARDILSRKPGATIIFEVKCSKVLEDDILKNGGNPIMWKAGHSLIKSKMKETKAAAAGEMSGHLFFADEYFGYDDAIYAACRLLRILAATETPLSEFLRDVPKTYATPEIRVDCPDSAKFEVVKRIRDHYASRNKIIDVDGVRVNFGDGWGLARASNTQPALVLRFEADTPERLKQIRSEMEAVVHSKM
ncbi:MAG TPA: phosphomannomutase/phosphoglucomutase [Acidobacteriota bacterium]|nr:phosphomannomutase/phosphoglucomutase [Acidobacteriota bacterium]